MALVSGPVAEMPEPVETTPAARTSVETRATPWPLYLGGGLLLLVAIILVVVLSAARRASFAKEARTRVAVVSAGPAVHVVDVTPGGGDRTISLTGESRPYFSVTLYSKVSGYLTEVRVDKGDKVHRDQVLAVVESPETDEAFTSAVADSKNKREIADRDSQLISQKLIAPEEAQTAETEAQQAEAHARALSTIKGYEVLRAPFDGVVTARFADPGALLQNAQTAQTSSLPVVAIGTTDSLRIYVYVDQRDAGDVRRGTPVTIIDPTRPDAPIKAAVSRYTGELDPQTRTLLAEIDVPNHTHALVAGSIVQVALEVHATASLHLPASAVFSDGPRNLVAVVTPQDRVAVHQIHVVDNDGEIVRFTSDSVRAGDRVAIDLGNSVPNGERVQPAEEGAARAAR